MIKLGNSLRFHRSNYANMYVFDDNFKNWQNAAMYLTCFIFRYSGLSFLLKKYLVSYLENKKFKDKDIVSFVFTKNHQIVYKQLQKLGINYPMYDFRFTSIKNEKAENTVRFHKIILLLASFANSKSYFIALKDAQEDDLLKKNTFKLFKLAGYEFIYSILIKNLKVAIKYNDHIFNNLLLYDMCEEQQIKTVYIQHAPVTSKFPDLHHDLNVLFSQDSLSKYKEVLPPKKMFMLFDMRMLASQTYISKKIDCKKNVLIAYNLLDDLKVLEALVKALILDYTVLLRPHPRDNRDVSRILELANVEVSRGNTIWEDMNRTNLVLSNESAVPLEAIYYGRKFYKIPILSISKDAYGFQKQGLITKEFFTIEGLIKALNEEEICFDDSKLKYFIGKITNPKLLAKRLNEEIIMLLD